MTRFFEGSLRFFYGATLGGKEIAQQIPFARKEDALPAVLSREQVMQLLLDGTGVPRPILEVADIFRVTGEAALP